MNSHVAEATAAIRQHWGGTPIAGVILGTGLGAIAKDLVDSIRIPFAHVPHFPISTAIGHRGEIVCGVVDGQPVVVMQGRCHLYEGYSASQVAFPVQVMHQLGIRTLLVTNAAGAVNTRYRVGDLMVSHDHINLMFDNPRIGSHAVSRGEQIPGPGSPYDSELTARMLWSAARHGVPCHCGVYVGVPGPNYETRAEYRMLRFIGGDVVGMSTVPEVLAARQLGLRVAACSIVTNVCLPDALGTTEGDEVARQASRAVDRLGVILRDLVSAECTT